MPTIKMAAKVVQPKGRGSVAIDELCHSSTQSRPEMPNHRPSVDRSLIMTASRDKMVLAARDRRQATNSPQWNRRLSARRGGGYSVSQAPVYKAPQTISIIDGATGRVPSIS